MSFHALLAVRDEADIIGQSLRHLLKWADHIHVFDTGSTDETWAIVQQEAARHPQIHPVESRPVYFNDTKVRSWLFQVARAAMRPGDWVLRCDADEFHHILPPDFVRERLRSGETAAYHQYYDFQFTTDDLAAWEKGRETLADRARPIEERRTHYTVSRYAEPRLFRYRENMQWSPHASFPFNAGFVARRRLPIRHYPNRDPEQMRRRCLLRSIMIAEPRSRRTWLDAEHHHWGQEDWRRFVADAADPNLLAWDGQSALPETDGTDHLPAGSKRLAQWIAHRVALSWLDRRRPPYPANEGPDPIPETTQRELARATSSVRTT